MGSVQKSSQKLEIQLQQTLPDIFLERTQIKVCSPHLLPSSVYSITYVVSNLKYAPMQGYRFKNSLDFGKKKLAHKEPISSQGWYHVRSQAFSHNSLSNAPNREEQTKGISVIIVITLCAIICRCDSFVAVEYLGHERNPISFWYRDSS